MQTHFKQIHVVLLNVAVHYVMPCTVPTVFPFPPSSCIFPLPVSSHCLYPAFNLPSSSYPSERHAHHALDGSTGPYSTSKAKHLLLVWDETCRGRLPTYRTERMSSEEERDDVKTKSRGRRSRLESRRGTEGAAGGTTPDEPSAFLLKVHVHTSALCQCHTRGGN